MRRKVSFQIVWRSIPFQSRVITTNQTPNRMSNYLAEMQSLQVKFVGELAVSNTVSKDATPAVGHAKEALCYQLFICHYGLWRKKLQNNTGLNKTHTWPHTRILRNQPLNIFALLLNVCLYHIQLYANISLSVQKHRA